MTEYCIDFTCLLQTTAVDGKKKKRLESWYYAAAHHALHNFGESHRLIDARNSKGQVLHHTSHHSVVIRFKQ